MAEYRVLVTAPAWIGDMVMAQSLFQTIKERIPEVTIDVLAPPWTLPVVQRMREIRQGIALHSRHGRLDLLMRIRSGRRLKANRYHEAIIIPRSAKAALPSIFAGIGKRTGHKANLGLINNVRSYRRSRKELFVRRLLALVRDDAYSLDKKHIPQPELQVDEAAQARLLQKFGLQSHRYVIFAPGAEYGPAKQWPLASFSKLSGLLADQGLQAVIMGSSKEFELGQQVAEMSMHSQLINLCGKTSLGDVIDLMNAANCVIANDSGLMHLGYASGARVIAIYGSSSPTYTPPLSDNSVVLQHAVDCQPCFDRTCRFGHYNCLNYITPEDVLSCI